MTYEQWKNQSNKKKEKLSYADWKSQATAKNDTEEKTNNLVSKGLSIAKQSIEGAKQQAPSSTAINTIKTGLKLATDTIKQQSIQNFLKNNIPIPNQGNYRLPNRSVSMDDINSKAFDPIKGVYDYVVNPALKSLVVLPNTAVGFVKGIVSPSKDENGNIDPLSPFKEAGKSFMGSIANIAPEEVQQQYKTGLPGLSEKYAKEMPQSIGDALGIKNPVLNAAVSALYDAGTGAGISKISSKLLSNSTKELSKVASMNSKTSKSLPLYKENKPIEETAATAETAKIAPRTEENISVNELPIKENKAAYEDIPIESHLSKDESTVLMPKKDVSGWTAYTNDVDRIFEKAYGKNYEAAKAEYLTPLNEAKKNNMIMQKDIIDSLKENVVDKFGFKKGSKESAAIQWYGEKQKPVGMVKGLDVNTGKKVKKLQVVEYTLDDLKKDFPTQWQDIVEADKWFRKTYDETIDKLNVSRKTIYGDVQAKVKVVEDEIEKLSQNLDDKTIKRLGLQQGRIYKTNKEIDISAQIKGLENRVGTYKKALENPKLKLATKEVYTDKINNLTKRIGIKQQELKKANLYGQPTAKTFEATDKQIARLEKLIAARKDLIDSEELWRGKMIPKRNDYYRHFREISDSVGGLKNLFDTPAQIDPNLVGISEFTKPNSKFLSLAQRRGKGEYTADAIGGMLDYTKAASYATHIDPQIQKFRNLATELAKETTDTQEVNHFIEYLQDYANNLSGKTNPFDRAVQKITSRKVMGAVNWVNNRVKANTILGNLSSVLAQTANIPLAIATVKNPKHLICGMADTLKSIFQKSKPMSESGFLMERYGDKLYSQFDTRIIDQPKKIAAWAMETMDRVGTTFTWNSAYRKALSKKILNPIQYADDITRKLVAGRGIGEVPIAQQAKVFQMIAPFQLEVANLWRVMGGMVKSKDFGGLVTLLLANYGLNKVMEETRGSDITFDPIGALEDAFNEKGTNLLQKAGRLGGEVLSNVPLGSNVADAFMSDNDRQKYLGRNDPTRFGNGLLAIKGIQDPWYKLALPFGGSQVKKTIQGLQTMSKGGSYTQDSQDNKILKYPIEQSPENYIKSVLFGPYAAKESVNYYNNKTKQLGSSQTAAFDYAKGNGFDTKKLYDTILNLRNLKPEATNKGVTDKQRIDLIKKTDFTAQQKELLIKLLVKEKERQKILSK